MRLFIAINFEKAVLDYLNNVQCLVKTSAIKGRYTLYHNFHLTLRFLGDYGNHDIESFSKILDDLSNSIYSFNIKIGNINSFNHKEKHILFVDVIKNKVKLTELVNQLDGLIDAKYEMNKNHDFKPHITIAREVVLKETSPLTKIDSFHNDILVDKVSLMLSSRNEHNVLTYTPLYTVNLK